MLGILEWEKIVVKLINKMRLGTSYEKIIVKALINK